MQAHRRARRLWIVTLLLAISCFILLLASPATAHAQEAPRQKTESPYFHVRGADASLDRLPLKSTEVDAKIAGRSPRCV